ncbi:MAG: SRPBCC family protein [Candidatus Eremiobacteraeota bacterium]|nr:SRPBCC family protein [Candidatus Eremiobacteraeota bacterium]
MKVLCSHSVDVRAPAEQVFDTVSDIGRWPTWFVCVVSAQQPQDRPLDLAEEIRVCLHAGRRRWQEAFEVTRFIRNAFLSFEALYSAARRIDFRFERRGQLTRLACSIGYPVFGGMLPELADAALRRGRVARELRDSLLHLKNMLEENAGATLWSDDDLGLPAADAAALRQPVTSEALRVR